MLERAFLPVDLQPFSLCRLLCRLIIRLLHCVITLPTLCHHFVYTVSSLCLHFATLLSPFFFSLLQLFYYPHYVFYLSSRFMFIDPHYSNYFLLVILGGIEQFEGYLEEKHEEQE